MGAGWFPVNTSAAAGIPYKRTASAKLLPCNHADIVAPDNASPAPLTVLTKDVDGTGIKD